jgi:hypothetical protein
VDDVSKAKSQLHHAKEERQERIAAFWQQRIEAGRQVLPTAAKQAKEHETRKPRQQQ